MPTACECIWQDNRKADWKTSGRRHPGTEGQVYSFSNSKFSSTAEGRGSCGMEWESWLRMGTRRQDERTSQARASATTEPHPLQHLLPWFSPTGVSGAQEWHRALYLRLNLQHQAAQTSAPQSLFATAPLRAQPHQPDVHRAPTTFPAMAVRGDGRLLSGQGCHLPNIPTGSSETDNSEPNPQQTLWFHTDVSPSVTDCLCSHFTDVCLSPVGSVPVSIQLSHAWWEVLCCDRVFCPCKAGADCTPADVHTASGLGGKTTWLTLQVHQNCQNSLIPRKDVIPQ